jgi:hypothetical protein
MLVARAPIVPSLLSECTADGSCSYVVAVRRKPDWSIAEQGAGTWLLMWTLEV